MSKIENALPCPICGNDDLSFTYHMSYGHGDCGYDDGGIKCNNCKISIGSLYSYGHPDKDFEKKAVEFWNTTISKKNERRRL